MALAGLLGAASASLVLARPDPGTAGPNRRSALPVETRAVTLQDSFTMKRNFSGRVQAKRESVLGFESAGRLARVLVDERAAVEAGQLLAELDT